jgi:hypothetical protein
MINAMFVPHIPSATAATVLFLFQIAMLVAFLSADLGTTAAEVDVHAKHNQ